MKNPFQMLAFVALAMFVASCEKENLNALQSPEQTAPDKTYLDDAGLSKALGLQELGFRGAASTTVYTMSNDASANKVYAYTIGANGTLTEKGSYSTTGIGTSTDLSNQGALTTGLGGHLVYAVNPGSNDMSVFYALTDGSLTLKEKISTGGTQPVSVTERNSIIYVLNAGGATDASTITGFGYNSQAKLVPIPGATMTVSTSDASNPTQISFSNDGKALVVTDKGTNGIHTFPMSLNKPTTMYSYTTNGNTPSGFAMGKNNMMMVSDAGNSTPNSSTVSNYRLNSNATISLIDGPLATDANLGGAMVMSKNGNSLYTLNSGSNSLSAAISVSGFGKLSKSGTLTSTTIMSGPRDAAMDADSKNMFVLAGGTNTLTSLSVNANGSLTEVGVKANLPEFSTGLIVR